jgi:hypothetical protein
VLVLSTNGDAIPHQHKLFVSLLSGVDYKFFLQEKRGGYKALEDNGIKAISSSYDHSKHKFAQLLLSGEWAMPQDMYQITPDWLKEKSEDVSKSLNLKTQTKFDSTDVILEDFLAKLWGGEVSCLEDYFDLLKETNIGMACKAAQITAALKNIEKAYGSGSQQLDPPRPMILTLKEYLEDLGCPPLAFIDADKMLGGSGTAYYAICWSMAKVFLAEDLENKQRCVILTGAPNSGKSVITRYCEKIFESHDYQ